MFKLTSLLNLKFASFILAGSLTNAYAMTDAQLTQSMRKDMEKYLITLKSPKIIFHWTDASDITPRGQYNNQFPITSPLFKDYVEKQGRKIYNKRSRNDSDIQGPGLYLAGDPLVSRSYGGENSFGLIVGIIKPGARLLPDVNDLSMSSAIRSELIKRNCDATDYRELLDVRENLPCTKVKQLLVGKDISFAEGRVYDWNTDRVPGCSSRSAVKDLVLPAGAAKSSYEDFNTFVLYSPKLLSNIYGYTRKSVKSGNKLADEILSMLKGLNLLSKEQMKNSSIKAMTSVEIEKFNQKYVFGCRK